MRHVVISLNRSMSLTLVSFGLAKTCQTIHLRPPPGMNRSWGPPDGPGSCLEQFVKDCWAKAPSTSDAASTRPPFLQGACTTSRHWDGTVRGRAGPHGGLIRGAAVFLWTRPGRFSKVALWTLVGGDRPVPQRDRPQQGLCLLSAFWTIGGSEDPCGRRLSGRGACPHWESPWCLFPLVKWR